mmetsp:Transcript_53163/g.112980  ORF Transcript_53163/g.112980 Transcript_53163/m.112980 type:complete len:220 (+) Transcript_53163:598-1257(+)
MRQPMGVRADPAVDGQGHRPEPFVQPRRRGCGGKVVQPRGCHGRVHGADPFLEEGHGPRRGMDVPPGPARDDRHGRDGVQARQAREGWHRGRRRERGDPGRVLPRAGRDESHARVVHGDDRVGEESNAHRSRRRRRQDNRRIPESGGRHFHSVQEELGTLRRRDQCALPNDDRGLSRFAQCFSRAVQQGASGVHRGCARPFAICLVDKQALRKNDLVCI